MSDNIYKVLAKLEERYSDFDIIEEDTYNKQIKEIIARNEKQIKNNEILISQLEARLKHKRLSDKIEKYISDKLEEHLGVKIYADTFLTPKEKEYFRIMSKRADAMNSILHDKDTDNLKKPKVRRVGFATPIKKSGTSIDDIYNEMKYKPRIFVMDRCIAETILDDNSFSKDLKKMIMFNIDQFEQENLVRLNYKLWLFNKYFPGEIDEISDE